jgi:hypothetical protein
MGNKDLSLEKEIIKLIPDDEDKDDKIEFLKNLLQNSDIPKKIIPEYLKEANERLKNSYDKMKLNIKETNRKAWGPPDTSVQKRDQTY